MDRFIAAFRRVTLVVTRPIIASRVGTSGLECASNKDDRTPIAHIVAPTCLTKRSTIWWDDRTMMTATIRPVG